MNVSNTVTQLRTTNLENSVTPLPTVLRRGHGRCATHFRRSRGPV
jgi:hypothetical protein